MLTPPLTRPRRRATDIWIETSHKGSRPVPSRPRHRGRQFSRACIRHVRGIPTAGHCWLGRGSLARVRPHFFSFFSFLSFFSFFSLSFSLSFPEVSSFGGSTCGSAGALVSLAGSSAWAWAA